MEATTIVRWLWIWITIGALVVVVVIGFLIGIVSSLDSIDDGLVEANTAVTGAGGDVKPLPTHIANINGNLVRIDGSLKPIPGQATDIIRNLRSIRGNLTTVDSSLKDTSSSLDVTEGSLVDTSGSLRDTSGSLVDTSQLAGSIAGSLVDTSGLLRNTSGSLVDTTRRLVTVRSLVRRIDRTLVGAQVVRSLGTNAIWRRVRFLNGGPFGGRAGTQVTGANPNGLEFARRDADNILSGLQEVNQHLQSICQARVLNLVPIPGLVQPGPC
jgi:hypothetical protein